MIKLETNHNDTLEDVVKLLLEEKEKRNSAYLEYIGKILYSDNVTLEKAYLEVLGRSKEEFENLLNMFNNTYEDDVIIKSR